MYLPSQPPTITSPTIVTCGDSKYKELGDFLRSEEWKPISFSRPYAQKWQIERLLQRGGIDFETDWKGYPPLSPRLSAIAATFDRHRTLPDRHPDTDKLKVEDGIRGSGRARICSREAGGVI